MSTLIDEIVLYIEDFLNTDYLKNYKNQLVKSKCTLNNNEYVIDKCKLKHLSEIFSFKLDKVICKKSLIHGLGVFAKQNINKGELITFYPGDFVEYHPNEDSHLPNHLTIFYRSERFENKFGEVTDSKYRNHDYCFGLNSFYSIIGCKIIKNLRFFIILYKTKLNHRFNLVLQSFHR